MYLSKAIGIELKGEKLLGLIDGAYAIVLTLLVIELPALIIESIGRANFNGCVFTDKLFKQGDTCFDFINQVSLEGRRALGEALFHRT